MKKYFLMLLILISTSVFLAAGGQQPMEDEAMPMGDDMYADVRGTVVTMAGPFTDNDAVKFNESVKAFEEMTGIDIQYEGSKEFEASISIRVEGGNPPDIVDFPQPGLLKTFVKKGFVLDLNGILDMEKVKSNYIQSWLDMATMESPDGEIMSGITRKNLMRRDTTVPLPGRSW